MTTGAAAAAPAAPPERDAADAPLRPPADWRRVTRARYRVRQSYRYGYTGPVTDVHQRLVMLPPERYGDQRLLGGTITVHGADGVAARWETDRFGNRIHHVSARAVSEAVEFRAEFSVERSAPTRPIRVHDDADAQRYLAATALTAPSDRIRAAADEIAEAAMLDCDGDAAAHASDGVDDLPGPARRQWALARRVGAWSAGAIRYQFGVTGVQTPAAMALHLGRGVCQDYAHIALAVLRLLEVPGRYVSGHLLGEGAPHAWYEALLPDPTAPGELCAVAYDPTHRAAPGLNYITVAVGRDYADVAPTSGAFSGAAAGRLAATKDAWIVELAGDAAA